MGKSFGWAGAVLFVDLSDSKITRVPTSDYNPEQFIGGIGLNTRIFWELGCPEVNAFHPDNPIIISTGPLTGIYGPFGRAMIGSISPQCYPQEYFSYSSIGGRFPTVMKCAGYDSIVITGKAKQPVYISIIDDKVEIKSAADAWGLDTFETQQFLSGKEPGTSMLVIGPAGEHLSRIAVILSETKFAAAVGGIGGVMGSKNLKAIAVRGSSAIAVARPEEVIPLLRITQAENDKVSIGRSWRGPYTEGTEEIRELFARKYYVNQTGCYGCPQQCHSIHYVPGLGRGACSCANWCWSDFSKKPKDIWTANVLMQRLGINAEEIIPGFPLFLRESKRRGILETREVEEDMGLPAPGWLGGTATDSEFLTVLLHKIARGESPYAEGAVRCIDKLVAGLKHRDELLYFQKELFSAHGYAFHVTNNLGTALHWATDTKDPVASCHEYGNRTPEAMAHFGLPPSKSYSLLDTSKTVYEGTEDVVAWIQESQCLKNSLPMCEWWSFIGNFFRPPDMDLRVFQGRIFTAVTGVDMDAGQMSRAGERIWNLRRAVMVKRENRTREIDTLNYPYFETAVTCYGGIGAGLLSGPIDRGKFEALKDRYYRVRGWDVKTGWPTRAKLEELGMKDIADKLAGAGKLP